MKKIAFIILGFCLSVSSFGQTEYNKKLIELGKAYKDFILSNEATKDDYTYFKSNVPENLKVATEFIIESITKNNKLLTLKFLSRPDDITLKQLYIIRNINYNLREENSIDNNKLIDSLTTEDIPIYELIDCYYGMLIIAVGNKNQPFDLSKINFKLNDYNLKDDTEKGIFFLRVMRLCGTTIWGYINVAKPMNTKKAYEYIQKFPKFNGRPYYQYSDFYFPDFEMIISKDKGIQSYKSYYLDKYFETLLTHLLCLNKENGSEKEKNDLLLGSILKNENLYKYTEYKDVLEDIFQKQERE